MPKLMYRKNFCRAQLRYWDTNVVISVQCMCERALCMRASVWICSTFVHVFQNNLAKLFYQRSESAI